MVLKKKTKKRAKWTKQWLLRTNKKGLYGNSERTLSRRGGIYINYMRMKPEHFDNFLLLAKEDLTKKDYLFNKILGLLYFAHGKFSSLKIIRKY